jgi:hypothetical protein
MIVRLWRGWTAPEDADAYEALLREDLLPGFAADVEGYRGGEVLRRAAGDEVAFVTLLRFDSMAAVEDFAGPDPGEAHVPDAARDLLVRWDDGVEHLERTVDHDASAPRDPN